MARLNILGVETPFGYRTIELHHGDITQPDVTIDLLAISLFAQGYRPVPGTVPGALAKQGVDLAKLRREATLDLVDPLGIWLARLGGVASYRWIACCEILGNPLPLEEVVGNLFAVLALASARRGREDEPVRSLAMPLLGTGRQGLPVARVLDVLVPAAVIALERLPELERIVFIERDEKKAKLTDRALDDHLGRSRIVMARSEVHDALRRDLLADVIQGGPRLDPGLLQNLRELLSRPNPKVADLQVEGRILAEFVVAAFVPPPLGWDRGLAGAIGRLPVLGVAPWIVSYLHILRVLGNHRVHPQAQGRRVLPNEPGELDLTLALICMKQVLRFWIDHGPQDG